MMKAVMIFLLMGVCGTGLPGVAEAFQKYVVKTMAGDLETTIYPLVRICSEMLYFL
jgi:hypothetical protein